MSDSKPTPRCVHFSFLPMGQRTLFTATIIVLSTGYLFAMIYIFESHAGRDGNPMLSVNDLIIAYSGSKSDTVLESALKGPMANMLPSKQKHEIIAWVRRGATKEEFDPVARIIEQRCSVCHDGSNPHIPNLMGYKNVSKVTQMDTGMDIFTLVRVSHIHLFGLTFIFFIIGSIFCHAYMRHKWLKCLIIALPFLSILFDIASWYLTKLFTPFAYVVLISGGVMGLCFAAQALISLYQMWFFKPSEELVYDV
ncbi:MAG: hypothetical protein PVJ39_08605 [Gammaproteobacteria bacterium]